MADPPARPLVVEAVSKAFATPEGGEVRALDDVSLVVDPGQFFVLLGPSGCGKTTLLRLVAGLEYPDDGRILLGDTRLDTMPAWERPVNTVFQSYALFPHLTVEQNIAFGLEMEGLGRAETATRVAEMLELVRLTGYGRRRPAQLSGGQQQRVALARALAKRPSVLLLDEPLSALDLKLRRGMQTELKAIQQRTGVTFVLVTHDQEEAMSMGDRIAVFREGRIAQLGSPREVYEHPVDAYVADFVGETNLLPVVVEHDAAGVRLRLPGGGTLAHDELDPLLHGTAPPAGPATLAVRPEHLRLAGDSAPLTGTVTLATYVGTDVRLTVDVAGTPVLVRLPARGGAVPAVAEVVGLEVARGTARTVGAVR